MRDGQRPPVPRSDPPLLRSLDLPTAAVAPLATAAAQELARLLGADAAACTLTIRGGTAHAAVAGADDEARVALEVIAHDLALTLADEDDLIVAMAADTGSALARLCGDLGLGSAVAMRLRTGRRLEVGWLLAAFATPADVTDSVGGTMESLARLTQSGIDSALALEAECLAEATPAVHVNRLAEVGWLEWSPEDDRWQLGGEARRLLGIPDDQPVGRADLLGAMTPEDARAATTAFSDTELLGVGFEIRARVASPAGGLRELEIRGTVAERSAGGRATRVLAAVRASGSGRAAPVDHEPAALQRIATAVAEGATPDDIFDEVAREVAGVLGVPAASVWRLRDGRAAVAGAYGVVRKATDVEVPLGGAGAVARAVRLGRPGRVRYADLPSSDPARGLACAHGYAHGVAAPIRVAGRTWGVLLANSDGPVGLAANVEDRLERFARLVELAIASTAARERLQIRAETDSLTGLLNRGAFERALDALAEGDGPLAMVLLDVDHFKDVNDTHGHPVGDRVLTGVAQVLRTVARADDVVARTGGEEFGWLLPGCSASAGRAAAERLRRLLARTILADGVRVTISAGVCGTRGGASGSEVYRCADAALYASKHAGRDRVTVHRGRLDRVAALPPT